MEIIGKAIDPTRIGNRKIDNRDYWHVVTGVKYTVGKNERVGVLLVAPVIGYERAIVRTPTGKDFEMSPAYYSAELLLDTSYIILTLRFFRSEIDPQGKEAGRRPIEALPSPLVEDFLDCIKELLEGAVRVVKPLASGFDVLAAEKLIKSKKSGAMKSKIGKAGSKKKATKVTKAKATKAKATKTKTTKPKATKAKPTKTKVTKAKATKAKATKAKATKAKATKAKATKAKATKAKATKAIKAKRT